MALRHHAVDTGTGCLIGIRCWAAPSSSNSPRARAANLRGRASSDSRAWGTAWGRPGPRCVSTRGPVHGILAGPAGFGSDGRKPRARRERRMGTKLGERTRTRNVGATPSRKGTAMTPAGRRAASGKTGKDGRQVRTWTPPVPTVVQTGKASQGPPIAGPRQRRVTGAITDKADRNSASRSAMHCPLCASPLRGDVLPCNGELR